MAAISSLVGETAARLIESPALRAINGATRVAIDNVAPTVDAGRVAVKQVLGDPLRVQARLYADGHDVIAGALRYRPTAAAGETSRAWRELPMKSVGDDMFEAAVTPDALGRWEYQVTGHVDHFASWQHAFARRAGEDATLNLRIGAELVQDAATRSSGATRVALESWSERLAAGGPGAHQLAASDDLTRLMASNADRTNQATSDVLPLIVNRERARTGAWYEVFPRSLGADGQHGTFRDVIDDLPRIKDMGFDVVYMPPIHPIGDTFRKGVNNAEQALAGDPGVPYAIGSKLGGHTAINPELGTLEDFDALVAAAREHDMEIGMDLAFQASPDHPWVTQHPGWFKHRPDGSIQYAENPPKKYQDVVPFDFESPEWPELWEGLTDSVQHWADRGVRAFRVDNPHTKPFAFWQHLIESVKAKHPDAVFLSEAFDRPAIQDRLGKAGFDQTYTYFPWKTTPNELRELGEHYAADGRELFITPSHWPTTHDILPENLQGAGRDTFAARATLASTMSPSWGNYGPAFELMENTPVQPGSIEFLNSEKYQLRNWSRHSTESLAPVLTRLNQARRQAPALQSGSAPRFLETANDDLVAYLRSTPDASDQVVVVANTRPDQTREGLLKLPLDDMGIAPDERFQAVDLLTGETYHWQGAQQYIELGPGRDMGPAHVLQIRRTAQTA